MSKAKSILVGVGLFLLRIVLIALGTAAFLWVLTAITALLKGLCEMLVWVFDWIVNALGWFHGVISGAVNAVPQWQYALVWGVAAAIIWTIAERIFKRYKK